MEKITVFLGDWQVLFREGIHFTLSGEEDIEVIGETTNNEDALNCIQAKPPTVAVLNADRGELTGVAATRYLKQNLPSVSVILILESDNEEQLFSVIKSGASACLTKDTDPDELISIIRNVAQGGQPVSEALLRPGIASLVLDEFEAFSIISQQVNNLLARLSSSESELLRHIADGTPMEQICQTLNMSEEAIRRLPRLILTKLVANDHNREVIEAAQSHLPSIISTAKRGKPGAEYITKDEFNEFKEGLRERFKSLSGELT